jgi:uncharacterized alkaline shock family protein YloU
MHKFVLVGIVGIEYNGYIISNCGYKSMKDKKQSIESMKLDTKEFELPETVYIRDIDNRVFQGIIVHCLSKIEHISLIESGFINHILGREEGIAGVHVEQSAKEHAVRVRVEVDIDYGISIPEKAEEIQGEIVRTITALTGLHVAQVHVVFKHLSPDSSKKQASQLPTTESIEPKIMAPAQYSDVF